jgi:hypothetical protein
VSAGSAGRNQRDDTPAECHSKSAHLKGQEVPLKPIWPVDTNLILGSGSSSNKLNLSVQTMMVRIVVGEAIDNVQVTLLFHNAFPDSATAATSLIEDCLLAMAEKHKQGPLSVYDQLRGDHEYMKKLVGLVRKCAIHHYITKSICSHVDEFHCSEVM